MRGIKKLSSAFLVITVILSAASIIINDNYCLAASEQASIASGIQSNKGGIAPDFTIKSMLKEDVSLRDYRGDLLVLAFGFGMEPAKDIEKYRVPIRTNFKDKGVNFLKVIHINIPGFGRSFVLGRMKKLFPGEETTKHTVIDWGGSLSLDEKYGIDKKKVPTLFIIGRKGRILFALQGSFSEDNLKSLSKEISNILDVGEDAYLGISSKGKEKNYLVGVTRIMSHKDLVKKQAGFEAAFEDAGYVEGKNVHFDIQDTMANAENIAKISKKFMDDKVDLIHCLSITGTMILLETIQKIPIIGYAVYRGDDSSMGYSGTNVTGIMVKSCPLQNLWPVSSQLEMYLKFIPESKKWGTVYNSGSVNTKFHIKEIRDVSQELGLELLEAPVSKPAEVKKAAQSLVGKVDAIYITSDEMAISAFEDIAKVCHKNNIPLFGGEFECVSMGAIAAYNANYFDIGYRAGEQGVRILKGEKPKDIEPEYSSKLDLFISPKNAEAQGISIPEEIIKKADKIL